LIVVYNAIDWVGMPIFGVRKWLFSTFALAGDSANPGLRKNQLERGAE
jgi:hypothetical protein